MEQPEISKGKWIVIGSQENGLKKPLNGYVFAVHNDCIEVGYLQGETIAVKEDAIWNGEYWDFKSSGLGGLRLGGVDQSSVRQGPPR